MDLDRRTGGWRWTGGLAVMGVVVLCVVPVPVGAQERSGLAVVDETLEGDVGDLLVTEVLAGAGVTEVRVGATPGLSASVAEGVDGCDEATARLDVTEAAPASFVVCVTADDAGTGSVRLIANDGSTAEIAVTAAGEAAAPARRVAPTELTVVTEHDSGYLVVRPGFAIGGTAESVAGGPGDAATVALSETALSCPTQAGTLDEDADEQDPSELWLTVCGTAAVGSYKATFDLNGATDGGTLAVTVVRRQPWIWAVWVTAAGAVASMIFTALTGKAAKGSKQLVLRDAAAGAEADFAVLRDAFHARDADRFAPAWAPSHWPIFRRGSTGTPDPAAAATTYRRAVEAAPVLAELLVYLRTRDAASSTLAESVRVVLVSGVRLEGDDTPESRVQAIVNDAQRAGVVRDGLRRLDGAGFQEVIAMGLVDAEVRVAQAEPPGLLLLDGVDGNGWAGVDAAPVPAGVKLEPRAALVARRGGLRLVAGLIALLVAVAATASDAFAPAAAWGTGADLVKLFGAAAALPALLDRLVKTIWPTVAA